MWVDLRAEQGYLWNVPLGFDPLHSSGNDDLLPSPTSTSTLDPSMSFAGRVVSHGSKHVKSVVAFIFIVSLPLIFYFRGQESKCEPVLHQSWQPPASVCLNLPGFKAIDEYPIRSPLSVADFLVPAVKNHSFCEIGTRNGDIISCLRHFSRTATAVEMDKDYCKKLRGRGISVICKPIEEVTESELGGCEVYFWWPMFANTQNEAWLSQLINMHKRLKSPATVYIAHDTHWDNDMATLPTLVNSHGGSVSRVFFDEGGDVNGPKSYSNPFANRPGQWGIMHLAKFQI